MDGKELMDYAKQLYLSLSSVKGIQREMRIG